MKFIQKNWLASAAIALIIIVGGVSLVSNFKRSQTSQSSKIEAVQKKTVATLEIKADGKTTHYDLTKGVGETALQVTQDATGGKLEMSGTGENAFITSINGRKADDVKKEYWKLVINGKDSEVGAGSYTVKENDSLVWTITTY